MKKVKFDIEVQTYQIDFVHHVSNIIYIEWMETGRTKLLQAIGMPPENLEKENTFPILVNTEIAYKRPIYYGDKVRAEIWISSSIVSSSLFSFHVSLRFFSLTLVSPFFISSFGDIVFCFNCFLFSR